MSQFEFETKEQREAWRVIRPLIQKGRSNVKEWCGVLSMDVAAARFDAREATCGIEPLSREHAILLYVDKVGLSFGGFGINGQSLIDDSRLTDKGREVLERLNAMCKVTA